VTINGEVYTSTSGIGNQIETNTVISLQNISDPSKIFTIVTGATGIPSSSTTALDLSNQSNADAVKSALESAFGITNAGAALTFQVGSTSTDTIGVSIGSSSTSSLFGGQSLDVLTQPHAVTAAAILEDAVNTVTALRAQVGALEERFTFASSAIQNAVQNQGAAKSNLLDTDVAATSTAFATAQVQLQAGIAVLAQANQLQQNLLKLIA
jgi:flagellin